MIARRGNVRNLYCDNGTNFVGTRNILQLESEQAIIQFNEEIHDKLLKHNTRFIFNPPAAPWFGGIWERHVGSIKFHLKRVVADKKLTFEELTTVLYQIEACLNSRPLCPLTDNADDLEALTPGHFIIGYPLTAPIELDLQGEPENRLSRWELCKRMRQDFWSQWSNEYVSQLQLRSKWSVVQKNLETGDLVLIKDENTAPLHWPLGRIKKIYRANAGLVRVVDVLSNGKTYKRPIGKLSLLPVKDDEEFKINSNEQSKNQIISDSEKLKRNTKMAKPLIGAQNVSTMMLILLFVGMIASVFGKHENFNITTFKNNPGIIFNKCH